MSRDDSTVSNATGALARGESRTRQEVDALVVEIATVMSAGKWVVDESHAAFAERENVAPATVRKWAVSASRMLRLASSDAMVALRARNVSRLDHVYDLALDSQRVTSDGDVVALPDLKAAVSAVAEQNKVMGFIVQKHEVAGVMANADFEELRAALMTEVCPDCRTRVLAKLREGKATDE